MNQLNVETIKLTDRRTSFNVSSIIALSTLGVVAQIHQYMQVDGTDLIRILYPLVSTL